MTKAKVFFAIFILIASACKKSNSSGSNSINYSIDGLNDNSITTCSFSAISPFPGSNLDSIGGPNCGLYVWRQSRNLDGTPSVIIISADSNCDLTSGSIPYSTSNFSCRIVDDGNPLTVHQTTEWVYPYGNIADSMNLPKGHLTMQITYRNAGRIKGTITGGIYGIEPGFQRVANLNCDFDVVVPVR